MDSAGRVFFIDRLGDTFRWKSENVSTNEVADVLGQHPHVAIVNVYGVKVPRADGRCGCAALTMVNEVSEANFDFEGLARLATESLPPYAVPRFLRLAGALDYTGTFKLQKGKLREDGIDVDKARAVGDALYWLPSGSTEKRYVPFGTGDLEKLQQGQAKL
jgi:acyl-CoA synthetase (AMP-forming)/AMP-acid ligase II